MMRSDLDAARAKWIDDAKGEEQRDRRERSALLPCADGGGRVPDFHALRHTYITRLVSGGASVTVAQELARHSDSKLTIGRYAHVRIFHDLSTALNGLPATIEATKAREALAATGSDGRPGHMSPRPATTPEQAQRMRSAQDANHSFASRDHATTPRCHDERDTENTLQNTGFRDDSP